MKKIGLAVAAIFIVGLFCVAGRDTLYAKELKIGYVDMEKISRDYTKVNEYRKAFDDKLNAKEEERKKLVDEIRKLKDEQALLSDKARLEKQKVIDEKTKGLQDFVRKVQGDLVTLRDQNMGEIQDDINKIITNYSKEAGYDIILIRQGVLYASDQFDVTDELLKRLNKK